MTDAEADPVRARLENASQIAVGNELPPFELRLTSTMVVAGAIASRDFMPAHHDPVFAKAQVRAANNLGDHATGTVVVSLPSRT